MATLNIDLKKMFEAGVHFGHFRRRWHPNMAPYIHSVRGGRCIIDLATTQQALEKALPAVEQAVIEQQNILFVGTKRQAKVIVQKAAESVKMPYVVNRWVGGMLTNYATISIQIKKLSDLERQLDSGELANKYSKLEVQNFQKEIESLKFLYGGLQDMGILPNMVFIVDMQANFIAVTEANKLGIPVIALADTNIDPKLATYPIPANDDALRSLQMMVNFITEAIKRGQIQQAAAAPATHVEVKSGGDTSPKS